jgi:hypothetical protein
MRTTVHDETPTVRMPRMSQGTPTISTGIHDETPTLVMMCTLVTVFSGADVVATIALSHPWPRRRAWEFAQHFLIGAGCRVVLS